jgi:hypothetical protein
MRRAHPSGTMAKERAWCLLLAGVMLVAVAAGACSGAEGSSPDGDGPGGAGQGGTGAAAVGGNGGSAGAPVDAGGVVATGGATGGSTGTSSYPNLGVCGERGRATADATSFDGYAERFLIGEQGFGSDVCAVRFALKRVGDAPGGCAECTWTHLLEYGDPTVVTDVDGACAGSDLGLDAAAIAQVVGTRVALGFAKQPGGAHGSARMLYVDATQTWEVFGNATWEESSKTFTYDYRGGLCNYGP